MESKAAVFLGLVILVLIPWYIAGVYAADNTWDVNYASTYMDSLFTPIKSTHWFKQGATVYVKVTTNGGGSSGDTANILIDGTTYTANWVSSYTYSCSPSATGTTGTVHYINNTSGTNY